MGVHVRKALFHIAFIAAVLGGGAAAAGAARFDPVAGMNIAAGASAGDHVCLIGLDRTADQPSLQVSCTSISALSGIEGTSGEDAPTLRLMAARADAIARAAPYLRSLGSSGMHIGMLSLGAGERLVAYVIVPARTEDDAPAAADWS